MCLGIPGKIIGITDPARRLARVDVAGVQREINIACVVSDLEPLDDLVGQWVLVHVGFAMSRVDADEARQTLEVLARLGAVDEERQAMLEGAGS